jgi:hypothetical protein
VLAAIIVGALTAWYLGLRLGVIVAAVTAAALLAAMVVPGLSLTVYVLVLGWSALLYFFGAKISKATGQKGVIGGTVGKVGVGASQAKSWVEKALGLKK